MTMRAVRVFLPLALLAAWAAPPALAHNRTTSYSSWEIDGRTATVTVRLAQIDVTRFPWVAAAGSHLDTLLGEYLTTHLELLAGDAPCAVSDGPRALTTPIAGRLVYEWGLTCPASGELRLRSKLFLDVAPQHLHFARVHRDGAPVLERVLSESERSWPLPEATAEGADDGLQGTTLLGYLGIGIDHILSGYDHLAFLLALLLIGGSLGEVAKVVTGFTVAHSITLGLTVLGYVRPDPAPIEALIGLSIALVAAENVWLVGGRSRVVPWVIAGLLAALALAAADGHGQVPALTLAGLALFAFCYFDLLERVARPASLRWGIAFIFGLIHGFGFASVLVEAGLPTSRLVEALFGFNAGVEVGQLAVVALLWPVLHYVARRGDGWRLAVLNYGSASVLCLGVFWFVSRAFG